MSEVIHYTEYWIFAVAVLIGIAVVHVVLWRKGKGNRISWADWTMAVVGLGIGWSTIHYVVTWQDARIVELIQKLVPMHAKLIEDGVRGKVILDGIDLEWSREKEAAGDGPADLAIGGAARETERGFFDRPITGVSDLVDPKGMWAFGFVPMANGEGELKAVLDIDYINEKRASAVIAMQGMSTAVVASLFLAVGGVVIYFRVRAEYLRAELEATRALAESEARFHMLFKFSPDAIFVYDENGRVLNVNPAACALLRGESEELMGGHLPHFLAPDWRRDALEKFRAQAERSSDRIEDMYFMARDGHQMPVEARVRKIDYMHETAYLLHVRDLTDRLALEHELRQAQKMEGIGQLAAGVAHDFNNLLTVIQGHTILMIENFEGEETYLHSLKEIGAATERASKLTAHLLTFSREQQMRIENLDVNEILGSFLKLLGRLIPEHIELKLETTAKVPPIRADRGMIEQVVTNLAVNARDAMPEGGRLKLSTSFEEIKIEELFKQPDLKPGEYVVIRIEDTGSGMDKKTVERIFEPFFTTKDVGKGTGLGLASSYGIIAQHGGFIRVDSELGKGTEFTIYLPARRGQAESVEAPTETEGEVQGGSETILVVEDEPALRELAALNLQRYGYKVMMAVSGREALDLWDGIKDKIDILLTDLVMPEGISGRELGKRLGAMDANLPIVYMSGYSGTVIGVNADGNPELPILYKPYTPDELARAIREALDERQADAVSCPRV